MAWVGFVGVLFVLAFASVGLACGRVCFVAGLNLTGRAFFVELCGDFVGFGVGLACLSNATKKGRKSRQSSGRG